MGSRTTTYIVQRSLKNLTIPLPTENYEWRVRPTKSGNGLWPNWVDGSQCPSLTRSGLSTNIKNDGLSIFPNPAKNSDKVFIQTPEDIKGISIFNLSGQVLYKESKNTKEIDIQDFDKGIYLIRINTLNDKVFTKRVVIE